MSDSQTLRELFYAHQGNLIHKWDHYFEIYDKHFSSYRGKKINILEIGISHGGSMQLWKKYFGDQVHIYAIDINPDCKKLEEENTTVFIGSQSDKNFLESVAAQLPELDIIIDDGGHTMIQQILSINTLFYKVKEGGIYLVEDTHTSYFSRYHGGLKTANSFIEYSKNLIDSLYESHVELGNDKLILNEITRNIQCISFYDSIVVFDKAKRSKPFHIKVGVETIENWSTTEEKKSSLLTKMLQFVHGFTNTLVSNDKGKVSSDK